MKSELFVKVVVMETHGDQSLTPLTPSPTLARERESTIISAHIMEHREFILSRMELTPLFSREGIKG
jgi:hypothetical protein